MPKRASYSGLFEADAESLLTPTSVAQLRQQLTSTVTAGGKLLPVGTGHSLDRQALTIGHAIDLTAMPHRIVVRRGEELGAGQWATCETTAWTPWDAVLRATLGLDKPARWDAPWEHVPPDDDRVQSDGCWNTTPEGSLFMPYVLPSSGRITVGGSLSADTIWRFSSIFGKESHSVVWLEVLTYRVGEDGKCTPRVLRLFNPDFGPQPAAASDEYDPDSNERFFKAAIGGFGLVGVILRAKFLLLALGEVPERSISKTFPKGGRPWTKGTRYDAPVDEAQADPALKSPGYPHTDPNSKEFGKVGSKLPVKALTWLWDAPKIGSLFETMVEHHRAYVAALPDLADHPRLEREASERTATTFGVAFLSNPDWPQPNSDIDQPGDLDASPGRFVLGRIGFGVPKGKRSGFKLWSRKYGYDNLGLVLKNLPAFARYGEDYVKGMVFDACIVSTSGGKARANPIPELAFFLEGHSARLFDMAPETKRASAGTIQQAFVIPFPKSGSVAHARQSLETLVALLREASDRRLSQGGIRPQVCDLKLVPKGHSSLASSPNAAALVVTIAIEATSKYKGPPNPVEAALKRIAAELAPRGVRVHLTKNLFVDPEILRTMYREQIVEFAKVKSELDPRGAFDSELWRLLSPGHA